MIVPFLIAGVFMLAFKVPFRKIRFNRPALFFLLTALASSLPFLISTRQHGRYILHSYPLFVLCLAFVTDNIAVQIESVFAKKSIMRSWCWDYRSNFSDCGLGRHALQQRPDRPPQAFLP